MPSKRSAPSSRSGRSSSGTASRPATDDAAIRAAGIERFRLDLIAAHALGGDRARLVIGIEQRVKAEARVAAARMEKLEARVDRMARALIRLLNERAETDPQTDEE